MRACAACGRPLDEGRRSTARYCDQLCRKHYQRGSRAPLGGVENAVSRAAAGPRSPLPAESETSDVLRLPVPEQRPGDPVPLMALDELARILADTIMDPATPRTALAGLNREYRATLAAIEARRPRPVDAVDELLARRLSRGGAS